MIKNKKFKYVIYFAIFILVTLLYFYIPLFVMPDSTEYYSYLKIFYGEVPFSEWNVVRGPTMPVILYIITLLFGNSANGILVGTYVFFMTLLVISFIILKKLFSHYKVNTLVKVLIALFYLITIVFNPILIGYYHGLLTEFIATTTALCSIIISFKWIYSDWYESKKQYFIYSITLAFLVIFSWFLKQPYVTITVSPFFIATIISIFRNRKIYNIFTKVIPFLLSIVLLVSSISLWKNILISNNVDYENGRNNEHFLSSAIVGGLTELKYSSNDSNTSEELIINDLFISKNNKNEMLKIINNKGNYKHFNLYDVYDNQGNIIKKYVLFYNDDSYTTKDALSFYMKVLFNKPLIMAKSYYYNYLATIDVFISARDDNGMYYPVKEYYPDFNHENRTIGTPYLYNHDNNTNFLWLDGHYNYDAIKHLKVTYDINDFVSFVLGKLANGNFIMFKLLYLALPLLFIYAVFKYIYNRVKKIHIYDEKWLEFSILLFGFAVFNILLHVVLGAIIDRYVYIAIPEIILGLIILFTIKYGKNDAINLNKDKLAPIAFNKKGKVLFVIPAYNEEQNIKKVLDEIKNDMPKADILVVNDCSKDNTAKIVEENGVKCISMPFNVGYACAVQTGLKYAYYNNYDYVIQFDADGQHIAKEAKRLLNEMEKNNCDIVIGSRFLNDTGYHHSFFRKIGTKIFTCMIMLICREKITDPTSGFQCLNRRVLEKYHKMGGYPEYPDANLIIEMLIDGYRISEIGVKMRQREFGESMHGGIIKPIKYMIKMFYTIFIIILKNIRFERNR